MYQRKTDMLSDMDAYDRMRQKEEIESNSND